MTATDHLSPVQFSDAVPPKDDIGGDIHVANGQAIVGRMNWHDHVDSVWVDPQYQHQGIATEMYNRASSVSGGPIPHDSERTDAGDAWAKHVGGTVPPRVKAQEY